MHDARAQAGTCKCPQSFAIASAARAVQEGFLLLPLLRSLPLPPPPPLSRPQHRRRSHCCRGRLLAYPGAAPTALVPGAAAQGPPARARASAAAAGAGCARAG